MGKAPAFQFYVRDWLSDPQLRMTALSTRGIWIDLLCFMWEAPDRGELVVSDEDLRKMTGANLEEIGTFWQNVGTLSFCDISVTNNGKSRLRNRRMWREERDRENNRIRQARHRGKRKNNTKVTPPSSSSSSSSPTKKELTTSFERFWKVWKKRVDKMEAMAVWMKLKPDDALVQRICKDVETRMASEEWTKEGRQFCPGPARYLRKKRWLDEMEVGKDRWAFLKEEEDGQPNL